MSSSMQRRRSEPILYDSSTIARQFQEHLSRSDLFSGCSAKVQKAIASKFHYRAFDAHELLIQSGTRSNTIFVLLKGQVQVLSHQYEAVLAELGPGMFFGEIGALFGVKRTADVVGKTKGVVAILSRDALKATLQGDPILWNHIKGIAAARYHATTHVNQHRDEAIDPALRERAFLQCKRLNQVKNSTMEKLIEIGCAKRYRSEEIVDFFSPRSEHLLYLIVEGIVHVAHLNGAINQLSSGDLFLSFDQNMDFAKMVTDGVLITLKASECAAIFAAGQEDTQIFGEQLLHGHLTDQVNANSSLSEAVAIPEMAAIVSAGQFSRQRRCSVPVCVDQGQALNSGQCCVEVAQVPVQLLEAEPGAIQRNRDLRHLLSVSGMPLDEHAHATLLHENRLNLAPIGGHLTDSLLLAILNVIGQDVQMLNLSGCHELTGAGISALWQHCPNLEKIVLNGCWNVDDSAFTILSKSSCARTLQVVELSYCWRLTVVTLELLAGCKLVHLDLSHCKLLDDKTWPALTAFAGSLRWLSLRRISSITDASIEGIFGVRFDQLEYLDIGECPFLTDAFVTCVLQAAPCLRHLSLAFDNGLRGHFVLDVLPPSSLESLDLRYLQHGMSEGFFGKLVANCPGIRELKLDGCSDLSDAALLHVTSGLPKLEKVSIAGCEGPSQELRQIIDLKYQ